MGVKRRETSSRPRKAGSERASARSEVTRAARASADRDRSGEGSVELVALGLEMATGPALILDRDLRIRAITEGPAPSSGSK